ncbi:hypothetical protein [Tepidimonas sp.]|uniref:hypothetical protein n=1 Tax=Tepidimonas sp. TaxID=2002775 RepID=UPI0039194E6A
MLTPQEQALKDYMVSRGYDVDIHIAELFRAMLGRAHVGGVRKAQQRLGVAISRHNKKQNRETEGHIVPGQLKQTYRITRTVG